MADKLTWRMSNKSDTFKNWCQQVDKIIRSELPAHSITGMQPLEYSDDEFQNCMRKITTMFT
jgi:hypothetical protein